MIHSFPYTPDCLALSTWVAAEDGDAEALSMLAAEAQGKQQQAQHAQQAAMSQGHAGLPAMAAQAPGAQQAQQQAACMQAGVPSPASVFGLPDQSGEQRGKREGRHENGRVHWAPTGLGSRVVVVGAWPVWQTGS